MVRYQFGGESELSNAPMSMSLLAKLQRDILTGKYRPGQKLTEQNLKFLTEQVRAARSRFEVGEGTRTDVAQAEAQPGDAVHEVGDVLPAVHRGEDVGSGLCVVCHGLPFLP